MNEIIHLLNEYSAIPDKESLYARVLKSFIDHREKCLRDELHNKVSSSISDPQCRAILQSVALFEPLERLVKLYRLVSHRAAI
jgi:hypothetical protein